MSRKKPSLGLSEEHSEPIEISGEVALIGGRAYPKKIAAQRQGLEARIRREGFGQVMEAVAYTWFKRFAALLYMELHGYRVFSHHLPHAASGALPEILEQAASVELPGLPREQVIELKLAGNQDAELYRRKLVNEIDEADWQQVEIIGWLYQSPPTAPATPYNSSRPMTRPLTNPKYGKEQTMWHFTWILGVSLADSLAVLKGILCEARNRA